MDFNSGTERIRELGERGERGEMCSCKGLLCDRISQTQSNAAYFQLGKVMKNLQCLPPCNSCQVKDVYKVYLTIWSSDLATNEDNNMIILYTNTNITCLSEIKPRNKRKGII